jgi:DNA-binding MarR family transcriptional regulator/ribosomal protein S18 acetylase RimI-like enzyme
MDAAVSAIRSFNRTVAERIGALNDSFLGCGRPLGESRLLWEIGTEGAEIRDLRARLALDSGYLSRVLRSLESQRLISVRASAEDRRVRLARLTKTGLKARAELDRRSDDLAVNILDVLTEPQRTTLTRAMSEVERLLKASMITFAVEDPTSADANWCYDQYFAELNRRFEGGFRLANTVPFDIRLIAPPHGALVLARLRGAPVGCGALRFHGKKPTYLKRMWVSSEVRGMGVGRRLLAELERVAKKAGAPALQLETNRALTEAIALYRSSGYKEVARFNDEPYGDYWFEKRL